MEKSQLVEDFLNTYHLLTPKQRRIWNYLHSFAKRYRNVFPSQQTIAEACGCHRSTVIEAVKKFVSLGWLGMMRRAYKSCLYYISDKLIRIDLKNPLTFVKKISSPKPTKKPTQDPTVINKYSSYNKYSFEEGESKIENLSFNDGDKSNSQDEIPLEIYKMPVPMKDKVLFAKWKMQNPKAFYFAYEDLKGARERNWWIDNFAKFFTSRFWTYAKGEGSRQKPKEIHSVNKPQKNLEENNKSLAIKYMRKINSEQMKGKRIEILNKYVEVGNGIHQPTCVNYDEPNFEMKLKQGLKRWGIACSI